MALEWGRVRVLDDSDAPVLAPRQLGRDPLPVIKHESHGGSALMDTAHLEPRADQVHRVVGKHQDRQMSGNAVVFAVIQRSQTQLELYPTAPAG
ncbi:MAG: hypothetical protein OXI38_14205 [Bacteroidota bacterium]|nr:hypothetical protein [Bacteroidota bacterium]